MRPFTQTSLGVAAVLCFACGSNGEAETRGLGDTYPELQPPEQGVQLQTVGREIPAGADEEWCEVAELPGEPDDVYYVGRAELAMARFSHHLIVSVATGAQGDSPRLRAEPLGTPVRCPGSMIYGNDLSVLTTSSVPHSSDELPPGIGHVLHGGQRVVFDYHVRNASDEAVRTAHRLNLHTSDHIEKQARYFGFYNQYLVIPPHSARSFTDECVFKNDVLVWNLLRHTHRTGTAFEVSWAGAEHDGEHLWTSNDWEEDIRYRFDEPKVVPAGTGFRWTCAFDNPTGETLIFGPEATDEMCILFGQFAGAGNDASVPPQSCYRFTPP
jgi:hypothetical protein